MHCMAIIKERMDFMEQFNIVLNQLILFFVLMIIGYIAVRLHVVGEEFLDGLSRLITRILLPLLVFSNAVSGTTRSQLFECYPILLLTLAFYISIIVVCLALGKILRLKGERNKVFRAAFVFGNAGFIGIPLITAIFPENGPIYIALMSIIDQTFMWTYGLKLTTPASKKRKFNFKNFINPALCAVILSLILLLLNINTLIPDVLVNALSTMGKAATPLSLFYLGGLFHFCNWKSVLKAKELYAGIVVKMIAFPLAFYAVASMICPLQEMVRTISIIAALPTMTTIAMFTKSNQNQEDYAVGFVLMTTAASLITLSIVSYFIL